MQAKVLTEDEARRIAANIAKLPKLQTLQRAMQSGTDMAAKLTERSLEQWTRAAERSSKNVGAILQSSLAIADTTQSITREWLDFARERIQHNFDRSPVSLPDPSRLRRGSKRGPEGQPRRTVGVDAPHRGTLDPDR
jgi:hypothetical protein